MSYTDDPAQEFWRLLREHIKNAFLEAVSGNEELALAAIREYIKFIFSDENAKNEIDTLTEEELVRAAANLHAEHPELLPEILELARKSYAISLQIVSNAKKTTDT